MLSWLINAILAAQRGEKGHQVGGLLRARLVRGTVGSKASADTVVNVRILGPATRDDLVLAWLRSEWDRVPPPRQVNRDLIDSPDLSNAAQNAERAELLYRDRGVILKEVPTEVDYVWVLVEEADLEKLFILPSREWYLDTGGGFRLVDTPANLAAGREFRWGSYRQPINHLATVDALAPKLIRYDAGTTEEVVILIATNWDGPYTIIDGSHRAAALYRNSRTEPNLPWKALLAVGAPIADCIWYIEAAQAQKGMAGSQLHDCQRPGSGR
jgi:hypothetical protein